MAASEGKQTETEQRETEVASGVGPDKGVKAVKKVTTKDLAAFLE